MEPQKIMVEQTLKEFYISNYKRRMGMFKVAN